MGLIANRLRDTLSRKPSGLPEMIGGHKIPPEEDVDDATRIAALEDAVRTLRNGLSIVADEVERLGR